MKSASSSSQLTGALLLARQASSSSQNLKATICTGPLRRSIAHGTLQSLNSMTTATTTTTTTGAATLSSWGQAATSDTYIGAKSSANSVGQPDPVFVTVPHQAVSGVMRHDHKYTATLHGIVMEARPDPHSHTMPSVSGQLLADEEELCTRVQEFCSRLALPKGTPPMQIKSEVRGHHLGCTMAVAHITMEACIVKAFIQAHHSLAALQLPIIPDSHPTRVVQGRPALSWSMPPQARPPNLKIQAAMQLATDSAGRLTHLASSLGLTPPTHGTAMTYMLHMAINVIMLSEAGPVPDMKDAQAVERYVASVTQIASTGPMQALDITIQTGSSTLARCVSAAASSELEALLPLHISVEGVGELLIRAASTPSPPRFGMHVTGLRRTDVGSLTAVLQSVGAAVQRNTVVQELAQSAEPASRTQYAEQLAKEPRPAFFTDKYGSLVEAVMSPDLTSFSLRVTAKDSKGYISELIKQSDPRWANVVQSVFRNSNDVPLSELSEASLAALQGRLSLQLASALDVVNVLTATFEEAGVFEHVAGGFTLTLPASLTGSASFALSAIQDSTQDCENPAAELANFKVSGMHNIPNCVVALSRATTALQTGTSMAACPDPHLHDKLIASGLQAAVNSSRTSIASTHQGYLDPVVLANRTHAPPEAAAAAPATRKPSRLAVAAQAVSKVSAVTLPALIPPAPAPVPLASATRPVGSAPAGPAGWAGTRQSQGQYLARGQGQARSYSQGRGQGQGRGLSLGHSQGRPPVATTAPNNLGRPLGGKGNHGQPTVGPQGDVRWQPARRHSDGGKRSATRYYEFPGLNTTPTRSHSVEGEGMDWDPAQQGPGFEGGRAQEQAPALLTAEEAPTTYASAAEVQEAAQLDAAEEAATLQAAVEEAAAEAQAVAIHAIAEEAGAPLTRADVELGLHSNPAYEPSGDTPDPKWRRTGGGVPEGRFEGASGLAAAGN